MLEARHPAELWEADGRGRAGQAPCRAGPDEPTVGKPDGS